MTPFRKNLWAAFILSTTLACPSLSMAASAPTKGDVFLAHNAREKGVQVTASGLQYKVITLGKGPKPRVQDTVKVTYKGTFIDGRMFDQSQTPITFGVGQVVPGWTEALQLMPVGSRFRLWLPPKLGYGSQDNGPIPANSVLVFDVTLLGINP